MKQKVLSIVFTSNGETVPQLTKCPATIDHVMSALHFLTENDEIHISIKEIENVSDHIKTNYDEK